MPSKSKRNASREPDRYCSSSKPGSTSRSTRCHPKSAVGKAIAYSLGQWEKLERYLECGHLQIDNNRAERAIKPFVIGRKNWLFANTANGANASAVLYSLIETAKANGLTPFDYLQRLMEELPKTPIDIDRLLPWNIEIPQQAET